MFEFPALLSLLALVVQFPSFPPPGMTSTYIPTELKSVIVKAAVFQYLWDVLHSFAPVRVELFLADLVHVLTS